MKKSRGISKAKAKAGAKVKAGAKARAGAGTRTIRINPVTRLEGHGRIDIELDRNGEVSRAFFVALEFRGFERFCVGRPAEEMPRITPRICGVCPTAHHIASTRALDDLFEVTPPPAAEAVRELVYNAFFLEDHLLHFFVLAGPDLVLGHEAPVAVRNILGLVQHLGQEAVRKVVETRKVARAIIEQLGGKVIHPVLGLPGGVSRRPDGQTRELAARAAALGRQTTELGLGLLRDRLPSVAADRRWDVLRTHYMGLVDEKGRASFHRGEIRVVGPAGNEVARFDVHDYLEHIAERVDPDNYLKMPYLRQVGWKGLVDGADSGVVRVGPLARINAARSMASKRAEQERQALFTHFGGYPVHDTLAYHWARLVECLQACDRLEELSRDPVLDDPCIRNPVGLPSGSGIAAVEAPRGTLVHHYRCDSAGILTGVNLVVATVHNAAAINMSVERAARAVIRAGEVVDEPLLNQVEMAFRHYDPCLACATHALPGKLPLVINIIGPGGTVLRRVRREV